MKPNKPIDPMQAFLTGWLSGCVHKDGPGCMKIVELQYITTDGFEILFASGLRLAVKVEVVEQPQEGSHDAR